MIDDFVIDDGVSLRELTLQLQMDEAEFAKQRHGGNWEDWVEPEIVQADRIKKMRRQWEPTL